MPNPQSSFETDILDVASLLVASGLEVADVTPSPTNPQRVVFRFHRAPDLTAVLTEWGEGTLALDDGAKSRARKLLRAKALVAVEQGGGR